MMKKVLFSWLLFVLALSAWSQSIWTNPITDSNPSAYDPFTLGQTVNANLTVSGIGRGAGIAANAGANRYNAKNFTTAMSLSNYFYWTLTPNSGYEIDFTSLVFKAQSSSTGPINYALRSSADNYASDIATFSIPTSGNEAGPYTADLSAFQNMNTAITFRMFAWGGSAAAGTNSINEFTFNGTVSSTVSNAIATTGTYGPYCNGTGNAVSVSFTPTGTFTGSFTAQLSNAGGSFASPTVIGTGSSSPISATIPAGTLAGTGYRIRVVNSNPATTGTDNGTNITIKATPTVNLGNDTSYCQGTPLNLTLNAGNTGATYLWSNSSTGQTLNVAQAGTFSVTVTSNGCQATDQRVITEKPAPVVNLGSNVSYCAGTNFSQVFDAGNIGSIYNWNGGAATTQTYTATTAGTYSVVVTGANGCQGNGSVTVTQHALPVVNLGNDLSYCTGSSFSQTLDAGNVGATYNWNNGAAATQTYTATTAGTYSVVVTDANNCQNTDTVVVIQNALPVVNLGSNSISYCAGTNFSQTFDAGNPGSTYSWTKNISVVGTSQTYTATSAGIYTVLVTDANGCQGGSGVLITENAVPTVNLGNDLSYCAGASFSQTLNAGNAGATYDWNNGLASTQTLVVTTAGTYSVVVTNGNGCQGTDEVVVTENALPVVNLGNDLSYCVGSSFSQALNAGNTGASYNWNNGLANTQTLTVTTAGTYSVIVTNGNGCEGTDTVVVTQHALPVVNLGNDLSYCVGSAFSQTLDAGNAGSIYNWNSGAAATQTFTATTAGTYSVVVTDGNGCQGSDAVVVTQHALPVVNLGNDLAYCVGSSFSQTLNAGNPGATYNWNNGLAATQALNVTAAGTYSVVVTDANGCQGTDDVVVTAHPLPIVNLGNDTSYCAGASFALTLDAGNSGASYSWNGGGLTSPMFFVTQAGTYSVVVTDANGCQGTDALTVTAHPIPVVSLGNDTSYCTGSTFSLVLNAHNTGSTYLWNNGSITQTVTATQAGTYSVTVTDVHGCINSDQLVVTQQALPVVNLGNDITSTNSSVVLNAGPGFASYSWAPTGQNTQQIVVTHSGTYTVTVTNAAGCSASDDIVVTLGTTSIEENGQTQIVAALYPNPATDRLNVSLANYQGDLQVSIVSVNGQRLWNQQIMNYENNQAIGIDLSNLSNGMYILQIVSKGFETAKMFVISK